MRETLELQKKAFIKDGPPTYNQRVDSLKRCMALIETHDDQIVEALNQDYKNRSHHEIRTSEIDQSIRNFGFTLKNLKKWMKPSKRTPSFGTGLMGAKTIMKPMPLGSVGVIAPWNFPVGMVFYPAASILAAGNRIMAKPSEFTPNTSQLIKEAVEKYGRGNVLKSKDPIEGSEDDRELSLTEASVMLNVFFEEKQSRPSLQHTIC